MKRTPEAMPSCLIAEDEAIIAMALADGLEEAGHHVLGPFDKGSGVLEALTRLNPDIAVLDTRLRDGPSYEVALELRRRGIPFVIYSGHQRLKDPHPAYADAPWIEKPASPTEVMAAFGPLRGLVLPQLTPDQTMARAVHFGPTPVVLG